MANYRFSGNLNHWINNFFGKINIEYGFPAGFETELLDTFEKEAELSELQNASPDFELEGNEELWLEYLNPMLLQHDLNHPSGKEVYEFLIREEIIKPYVIFGEDDQGDYVKFGGRKSRKRSGSGKRRKTRRKTRRKRRRKRRRKIHRKTRRKSNNRSRKTRRKLNKRSRRRSRRRRS